MADRPNILLIISDEERRNDWLHGVVDLPAHQRLRGDGLSFDRYFTHASPCSPSRASLYTGRYLAEHGVVDNVAFPTHTALDPAVPTIGSLLADRGYRSSYLGKWHLGHGATHVDLAATIAALGGVDPDNTPTLSGRDLAPVLADPSESVRDFVLFSQDSAQSDLIRNTRYAVRGFHDGETKYARYYGIGGGIRRDGTADEHGKIFDVDAHFDDHDHEWYQTGDDPHELVNLANDRGRRNELRALFCRLLDYEAKELTLTP